MLNSTVVDSYFETLNKVITDLNLSSKPEAIWNADETGFQMEHQPASVCARRGAKVPGRTSNSRESISTLLCVNAQGGFMPPMVVDRGKTKRCLQSCGVEDAPAGPGSTTFWARNGSIKSSLPTVAHIVRSF